MNLQKHKQMLITAAIVAISSLGAILAYSVFDTDLKQATAQDVERRQKQLATIAASEIEHYFYDIQKRMETIALMPNVQNAQRSEACNLQLQKLVEVNNAELNNLGRVSKDGVFICAVNRTIIGESVSKYGDYFQKITAHPQHKPAMSRLIFPAGSASPVIAVHVPVHDANGTFNGTIGGAVYFNELQERILAGTRLSKNSTVALYDNNLDVLYSPDPLIRGKNLNSKEIKQLYSPVNAVNHFIAKTRQGAGEGKIEYSLRGTPHQVYYKSVSVIDGHWTVAVALPKKDIQELVGRESVKNLFIALNILLIAVAAIVAYTLLRSKSKSVRER